MFILNKTLKYGLWAVLFLTVCVFPASGEDRYIPDPEYIESLVRKAESLRLYDDSYWLRLCHYKRGVLGFRSLVDDTKFFASPDGKRSPEKEMAATIRSFFIPVDNKTQHAGVKYIARYTWLEEKLGIDRSKLPFDFRGKFDEHYSKLNIGRALLVFPAGYVNSPASMYGHTLIVLEPRDGNRLLSYAVNYAAITDESIGPIFMIRGLFGGYGGYFSLLPYYEKINEYSNGEMRDMWEYSLGFTDDEIRRMYMHLVEMDNVRSDYYFMDENCSLNLLYLMEIARPSLDLTSSFYTTVEPIDTLRAAVKGGVVVNRGYRPSLHSRLNWLSGRMDADRFDAALDFAKGKTDRSKLASIAGAGEDAALMYDFISDCLKFMVQKESISLEDYRARTLAVLRLRSGLPSTQDPCASISVPAAPESSHKSNKLTAGWGRDSHNFISLSYRPTCTDLIDSDRGIPKNSQIVFANTEARYYPDRKKLQLECFDIAKITALPSVSRFDVTRSFMFETGAHQRELPGGGTSLSGYLNGGLGASFSFGRVAHIYAAAKNENDFSGSYSRNALTAVGGQCGIISDFFDVWKSIVTCTALTVPWGDTTRILRVSVEERVSLSSGFQVTGQYSREYCFKRTQELFCIRGELLF